LAATTTKKNATMTITPLATIVSGFTGSSIGGQPPRTAVLPYRHSRDTTRLGGGNELRPDAGDQQRVRAPGCAGRTAAARMVGAGRAFPEHHRPAGLRALLVHGAGQEGRAVRGHRLRAVPEPRHGRGLRDREPA